jgi:hypothetical protein
MTHRKKLHLGHLHRVTTPHVHFTPPQGFKSTPPSELHIQKQLANINNGFHKVKMSKMTPIHIHTHKAKLPTKLFSFRPSKHLGLNGKAVARTISHSLSQTGKQIGHTTGSIYRDAKGIVRTELDSVNSLVRNPFTYLLIGGVILVVLMAK